MLVNRCRWSHPKPDAVWCRCRWSRSPNLWEEEAQINGSSHKCGIVMLIPMPIIPANFGTPQLLESRADRSKIWEESRYTDTPFVDGPLANGPYGRTRCLCIDNDASLHYNICWGYSSAVEHLVYTENVYGSNPYSPNSCSVCTHNWPASYTVIQVVL